jgi:hypothetical protein
MILDHPAWLATSAGALASPSSNGADRSGLRVPVFEFELEAESLGHSVRVSAARESSASRCFVHQRTGAPRRS